MAAVSAFLQPGAPRPYPGHYMETAIQTYRDICKYVVYFCTDPVKVERSGGLTFLPCTLIVPDDHRVIVTL